LIPFLTWSAVGLAAAGAISVCVLALRRLVLGRDERARLEAEARLGPLALDLLDGSDVAPADLSAGDARVLADLLRRLGRNLRGVSTERIAAFFEGRGLVAAEIARLDAGQAWRRATAAFTLGDMASPTAVPALLEALGDRDRDVRAAAARSLGRLGAVDAVETIVRALAEGRIPRSVAGQALLAIGPAALPSLRSLEGAEDAAARAFAIELVGLLGDASDGSRLVACVRDSSADVRAKAAFALGRLGAEEGAEQLRFALGDRIPFVRAQAARALGAVGDAAAVPELIEVARHDVFSAAHASARAAARLDPKQVAAAAAAPAPGPHVIEAADLLRAGR
jgi:HEAT repeat protein